MFTAGGQIHTFWQKNDPKYWCYANLDHLRMRNSHTNTFKTRRDSISSKTIANQQVMILYGVTTGGQIAKFSCFYHILAIF